MIKHCMRQTDHQHQLKLEKKNWRKHRLPALFKLLVTYTWIYPGGRRYFDTCGPVSAPPLRISAPNDYNFQMPVSVPMFAVQS